MDNFKSPFLPVARPDIGLLEKEFVLQAIESEWVSSVGPFVAQFETEFAEFVGSKHAVSTSNGTDALFIALKALGITNNDEVIIPALTFVAVASAVVRTGAAPCFVDVDPRNWCIDPDAVDLAISGKTKAIISVHSYGHPADMNRLTSIAQKHNLFLIEDCAEAHGARANGQIVGSIGHVGCFSFYGNKVMTTGEGGMITTNDLELSDRCRYLKDQAMDQGRTYYHSEIGFNCRMTNLQAALGCAQLRRLSEFLAGREQLFVWYQNAFADCNGLELNPKSDWAEPVVWMVCAVFSGRGAEWRDGCMKSLRESGIDSRPFFFPLNDLPPYKHYRTVSSNGGVLANTRRLSGQGINLPTSNKMSEVDVRRVAKAVMEIAFGSR